MKYERPFSKIAVSGLTLALAGALIAASSGFGYQIDLWHFKTGFKILEWGTYTASTGLIVSLLAIYFTAIKKNQTRHTLCNYR